MSEALTHSLSACRTKLAAETSAPGARRATVFRTLAKIVADIPRPASLLLARTRSTEDLCPGRHPARKRTGRPAAQAVLHAHLRLRAEMAWKAALTKHLPAVGRTLSDGNLLSVEFSMNGGEDVEQIGR